MVSVLNNRVPPASRDGLFHLRHQHAVAVCGCARHSAADHADMFNPAYILLPTHAAHILTAQPPALITNPSSWSFEPAGLHATLNKLLKGRGTGGTRLNFRSGFLLA